MQSVYSAVHHALHCSFDLRWRSANDPSAALDVETRNAVFIQTRARYPPPASRAPPPAALKEGMLCRRYLARKHIREGKSTSAGARGVSTVRLRR